MNIHQIIINGIKEQLFFNNYLVLPGFGGFVLKKVQVHFSASGGMIFPPSKTIGFNVQLRQNDGILAHWLQNKMSCTNSQAMDHLKDFADYCVSVLNNKGRLTIDGLGFFYSDLENNICFEPQQQINFLTSSFGLAPVSVKEPEIEIPVKKESVFVDRVVTGAETVLNAPVKTRRNYKKIAVLTISGLMLFSSILLFVSGSKFTGKFRAALFGKEENALYSPVSYSELTLKNLSVEKKNYVADANGVASLDLDNNKTIAVQALETDNLAALNGNAAGERIRSSRKNYHVVLGCFSVLSNARRMVKKLKSENVKASLSAQNHKGMYVVSAGGYDTKEEALISLAGIKNSYPNAWIKKAE